MRNRPLPDAGNTVDQNRLNPLQREVVRPPYTGVGMESQNGNPCLEDAKPPEPTLVKRRLLYIATAAMASMLWNVGCRKPAPTAPTPTVLVAEVIQKDV